MHPISEGHTQEKFLVYLGTQRSKQDSSTLQNLRKTVKLIVSIWKSKKTIVVFKIISRKAIILLTVPDFSTV